VSWEDEMQTLAGNIIDPTLGLGCTITYIQGTKASTFTASTGARSTLETSYEVNAVRLRSRIDFLETGAKEEVVVYLLRASDVPAMPDADGDYITDASVSRPVSRVEMSLDKKCYEVETRMKLGS
jgi:hypothetical protein